MASRSIHKFKHDNRIDPQEAPISLLFRKFVQVIARFVVISLGINTTSDISKLLYVISRAFRRVKFETILKYHEWYLCQMSRTNHAIICLYYHLQKICNFHMQLFQIKLKYHCCKQIKLQKFLMQQYNQPYNVILLQRFLNDLTSDLL